MDLFISVQVDSKNVARQLRDLEQQGERTDESLSGIGDGAERSQKKATGAFGKIARSLRTLRGEAKRDINVNVSVDTGGVERARQAVSGLRSEGKRDIRITVDAEVASALASLGKVDRAKRDASGKATVNVDAETAAALSRIGAVDRVVSGLDGRDVDLSVDADAAGALAELRAFEAARESADGKDIDVRVDVDTAGAIGQLAMFRVAAASVGGAIKAMDSGLSAGGVRIAMIGGIAATAAALFSPLLGALASVGSLGAAAGAGIGLIAAPLAMVIGRLKEYHEGLESAATAQKSADTAAQGYADAQRGVANAQRGVAEATAASNAQISAAEQTLSDARSDGARSIQDAERGLAQARSDGAAGIASAERDLLRARQDAASSVAEAERGLTEARRSAAQGVADAEGNLEDARDTLASATRSLTDAQEELNNAQRNEPLNQERATLDLADARDRASDAQRDYNAAVREYGANSEEASDAARELERAELDLEEQQRETNEARKNGSEELQGAREGVKTAYEEQQEAAGGVRTAEQQLAKARADGARQVAEAQRGLASAQTQAAQSIADAQRAVAEARADSTSQQQEAQRALTAASRDSARQIRDAEQGLADARTSAAKQVSDAQRAVADAQRAAAQAADAQAAAQADLAKETVTLPPALLALYNAAMRFKTAANTAFGPAQNAIARLGTTILRDATPALDVLGRASTATIGGLSRAWEGFRSRLSMPTQQASIGTILGITPQVIQSLTSAVGDFGLALINIFAAAGPSAVRLAGYLQNMMRSFLAWSGSTAGVNAVKSAIAAAVPVFSALWRMVMQVGGALFDFGVRNAPAIATAIRLVSGALTAVINGFSWLTRVFGPIVPLVAALTPVFLGLMLILGQLGAGVVALVGFLGAPLVIAIGAAALAASLLVANWGRVKQAMAPLMPLFSRVKTTLQSLGTVIKGLFTGDTGTEQFKKAFASLPGPIQTAIKRIVIAWRSLKTGFQQVWNQVRPILTAVGNGIKTALGTAMRSLSGQVRQLWNAFKQAWPGIKNAVLPVLTAIARGIKSGAGAAFRFLLSQARVVVNWFRKNWPLIQKASATVFNFLKKHITTTMRQIWSIIKAVVTPIVNFFRKNWGTVEKIFKAVWNIIKTTVSTAIKAVLGIIKAVMQAITGNWKGAWNTIKDVVATVLKAMKSNIDNVLTIIKGIVKLAWNAIKSLTSAAWEAVRKTITDKFDAARNRVREIRDGLQAGLKAAWEAIKSAASDAWTAISGFIWRPIETAYNRVVEFIDKIKGAINAVLKLVGLPELGSGDAASKPAEKSGPKGTGGSGSPMRSARTARGYAEGGRVRERPGGVYRVAEGGKDEWVVNPNSPGYEGHLRGAAAEGGYDVQRSSRKVREHRGEGTPRRGPHPYVPRSRRKGLAPRSDARGIGGGEGLGPTTYNWTPLMQGYVDKIKSQFDVSMNTYTNHPGGEQNSADAWAPGGRGSPIAGGTGDGVANWVIDNVTELNWLIWQGKMLDAGGWQPYSAYGGHYDHVHMTAGAGSSTVSGGGGNFSGSGTSGGIDPRAAIFEAAWERLVQKPIVDPILGPMKNANYVLTQAAGAAAQKIPDGVKNWISEKLGSTGGGTSFSGGGDPAKNRALGEKMLGASGVGGSWSALDQLWTKESGWNHLADNPTSAAYGIPQAMTSAHAMPKGYGPPGGDPAVQINWGLDYIKDRYGTTDDAWGHSQSVGWYDRGGLIKKEHAGILHPGEIVMPLDKPHVAQTFAALGVDTLIDRVEKVEGAIREGVRVNGYGEEAREVIVVGARQGGLGAMGSNEGRRIIKGQGAKTEKLGRISGLAR